ncbi:acyl-CoA dehydratase activase [Olsenella sp. HMSC062G07]|uniref:acyl-CoA dehydratase activase n=1 Tax=Olsenella sp. HMSC062G07 TaxID=1739330 RepID=UPI0008A1BB2F|nr:acyl-CoA dehydratase activase [Olsenella sp. HMSC062G07]MBS4880743.1 CoA activase [Bacillota bacterium]OFK23005.1 hypothetical protein HMPREF2826_00650 [Olsenella sp. HMSC062G07]
MYALGIDIGASSVKLVAVDLGIAGRGPADGARGVEGCPHAAAGEPLRHAAMRAHRGDPSSCLSELLDEAAAALPPEECAAWALTGSGQVILGDALPGAIVLEDVPAITLGASLLAPAARSIMEVGGQQGLFVTSIGPGQAPRFSMNEGCASGTGSFFEDQMQRLGLRMEDFSSVVDGAVSVPRLSGRCAVFAKTDIIHRQQEGVPVEDILMGLCHAMVKSFKALVVRGLPVERPMALSGGVLLNSGVVRSVRDVFRLGEGELLCEEGNLYFQAAGAALHAARLRLGAGDADVSDGPASAREGIAHAGGTPAPLATPTLSDLRRALSASTRASASLPGRDPLPRIRYEAGPGYSLRPRPWARDAGGRTPCALGIDVGSTSTNLVLVDEEGALLDAQYLRTRGNPKAAVAEGLASLGRRLGDSVRVVAVATTGSGREMIGRHVGADVVRDEITAQARAAAAADPQVDTVFEIGGQDSKYISLRSGNVVDFQMNKVCAAGTGSFVEEQAARMGIALGDFGALALSAESPVDLGERCTVFVETAINVALARGARKADVAAGLCQSIIRNYLNRVVGNKAVGGRIVLQGGVCYNSGIVAAFAQSFGDRMTVSPWFAVSGAVGAALLAWEAEVSHTSFRGWDLSGAAAAECRGAAEEVERNRAFFHEGESLLLEGYTGEIDPSKETVGVPRSLMMYKLFPMANAFFTQLGFNVVVSDVSDEETVRLSQQTAQGETCFPVKLMHGHVMQLVERGVDYIFMPRVHTIRHKHSKIAHNYGCSYMQCASHLVAEELGLAERGIGLISPELDLDFGQRAMAGAMLEVGAQLGRDPHDTARALLAGSYAVSEFTRKTEEAGQRLLDSLGPEERVLVMVTRNYGISDAVLNAGIPDALIDRGQRVITISHLHAHSFGLEEDYPNVYWPFGQHILAAAKLIRRDPRLFAIYLTNHGCGPDTMLSHLFAEEMGQKPYLQIEVDEHFSKVGVVTRIEAFLNSLDHHEAVDESGLPMVVGAVSQNESRLDGSLPVAMPDLGLPARAVAALLRRRGMRVQAVPVTDHAIARGKALSTTKEYLSFSAELGVALEAADMAVAGRGANEGCGRGIQLLLPSGEGADADGQYDRVILSELRTRGLDAIEVVSPRLDRLPEWSEDLDALFDALLAADVAQAADPMRRAAVLEELSAAGFSHDATLAAARDIAAGLPADGGRSVLALGEWPVVWEDALNAGTLGRLEGRGWRVKRMPASEYLWFLWRDAYEGEEDFRHLAERMSHVHEALAGASPFQPDASALLAKADSLVGRLRSANARYRIAKASLSAGVARGVIAMSSMYENTDIILQLAEASADISVPVTHVGFDGTPDSGIDERISSFVYYLR